MTGINIKVRFGTTGSSIIRVRRVTVKGGMNEIDETDSESGGYGDCDDNGVAQANVTLEGWIRSADMAPIIEGDLIPNVLIAWDGNIAAPDVNKREFYPKLKVFDSERNGEVRGGSISYTLTCKSSGLYYPAGVPGGPGGLKAKGKPVGLVVPNLLREPPLEVVNGGKAEPAGTPAAAAA